ncbi:MAG: hypothetical protein JWR68_1233 [Polaromonas sp.]|nr:hypothetical protein [Polaromonas sp.]
MLSALLAPVSLLAEEVRTGKLGGLCSARMAPAGSLDAGTQEAASLSPHCDWCGSSALGLPPLPLGVAVPVARFHVDAVAVAAVLPASVTGLPFSRGPPAA